MKSVLVIILLCGISITYANEISLLAYKESLKAHCNARNEIYEQCFNLSSQECINLFDIAISECTDKKDGFPIINKENMHQVNTCIQNKFEHKLIKKGINLDKPCKTKKP